MQYISIMNRISPHRQPLASTGRRLLKQALSPRWPGLVGLAMAVGLNACDLPPSFGSEYYDHTTNFINAQALALPPLATDSGGTVALDAPAVWDWEWRGHAGNSFQYMNLSGLGADSGPNGSGEAWRLESVNLAADPYLETAIHAAWAADGNGSVIQQAAGNGNRLQLKSFVSPFGWAGLNLSAMLLDTPLPGRQYTLFSQVVTTLPKVSYKLQTLPIADFNDPPTITPLANFLAFSNFSIGSSDTWLRFGAANSDQTLALDDLRLVRSDLAARLCLVLRLRPDNTAPSLVAGYYEFTLWARIPPDALAPASAGRDTDPTAPFAAAAIDLGMRQVGFLDEQQTPKLAREAFALTTEWQQFSLRMAEGSNFDRFDESSAEPVLELLVYPFTAGAPDVAAVEIAAPVLYFHINGYQD